MKKILFGAVVCFGLCSFFVFNGFQNSNSKLNTAYIPDVDPQVMVAYIPDVDPQVAAPITNA